MNGLKIVVNLHNEVPHSRKKEGNPTFHDIMDGSGEHYANETSQSVKDKYRIISPISGT